MGNDIHITVTPDPAKLADAYERKANQIPTYEKQLTTSLLNILKKWVKRSSPHKTGTFKRSIKSSTAEYVNGGIVFQDPGIAPYGEWVIDGRGEVVPKNKKVLHFFINGTEIFTMHSKATKENPVFDTGFAAAQGELDQRIAVFETWLTAV